MLGRGARARRKHRLQERQVTVLAPTGTIAFMMDCDTTGVEPDIALVKYKKLVGGGFLKIVNNTVPMALEKLGYTRGRSRRSSPTSTSTRRSRAPGLEDEHLPVFDCAFRAQNGDAIDPLDGARAHDGRGAALPLGRDQQDGEPARGRHGRRRQRRLRRGLEARPQGPRGLSRRQQAHAAAERGQETRAAKVVGSSRAPVRRKLDDERDALTHKFSIAGHEGYLTVGLYETGSRARSSFAWRRKAARCPG